MRVPFSDGSFVPLDRPYKHLHEKKTFPYLTLGACSYVVSANVEWDSPKKSPHVLIGRFCSIAQGVSFLLGLNHNYKNVVTTYPFDVDFVMEKICAAAKITKLTYEPEEKRFDNHYQIIVGNDVWIGQGATIIGGVKIGSGAIIGTNAMVTKDVPPYAIAAGNPARIVRYRFDAATIQKFMAIRWWNWGIKKIYRNIPLLYEPEKFLAKYYVPAAADEGNAEIAAKLKDGWKVYQFVADFRTTEPLWKKIITGFCQAKFEKALLVIHAREKDFAAVDEFIKKFEAGAHIMKIPANGRQSYSPQILTQATHFITTREMAALEILDLLYGADVKIISALDEKIFVQ